jgi:hypothetical protein
MYGIIAAVVGGITLIGCMVFLIQMQHPEDNNAAWLPKLIVLLGLFLACWFASLCLTPRARRAQSSHK